MKTIKQIIVVISLFATLLNNAQCFTNISSGDNNVLAKKSNGTFWIWGRGVNGELGNVSGQDEYNPISIGVSNNWTNMASGSGDITFAIRQDGTLWGTGNNLYGGLGVGTTTIEYLELTQIGTATNWKQLSSDGAFTMALKTDGTIWGWGQNNNNQMGDGSCCANRLSPGQVGTATDWKMVAVSGSSSTFAIKNNGTLWAWGYNIGGLLGNNLVSGIAFPTQHNPDTDWAFISLGDAHILALKTNGTLWAWGAGGNGQTGDGLPAAYLRYNPLQIGTSTWKTVVAASQSSYGIKTDGTLWAWGANESGQLGIGNTTNQSFPVQVGTDTNWDQVSAGQQHAVALKTDGSFWAWGNNDYGQYGNGTTVASTVPVNIDVAGCTMGTEGFASAKPNLTIYPNPATSELTVSYNGNEVVTTVEIIDLLGKTVFSEHPVASKTLMGTFSIAQLPSGSYIVVLKNNEKVLDSKKLVME